MKRGEFKEGFDKAASTAGEVATNVVVGTALLLDPTNWVLLAGMGVYYGAKLGVDFTVDKIDEYLSTPTVANPQIPAITYVQTQEVELSGDEFYIISSDSD